MGKERGFGAGTDSYCFRSSAFVKAKEPVFIDNAETEHWNCFEQDTIGVELSFSTATTATEVWTLANELSGEGCPAFIEAYPDATNYDGCAVVFHYAISKLQ
ncbi:MAG: hypothetical protein MUF54_21095 [Polyangiaceae bacterium]|nr:hypothetical protein [Polyangiaceae bacterium]